MVASCLMSVLKIEHKSSERAVSLLNCWAISSAPILTLNRLFFLFEWVIVLQLPSWLKDSPFKSNPSECSDSCFQQCLSEQGNRRCLRAKSQQSSHCCTSFCWWICVLLTICNFYKCFRTNISKGPSLFLLCQCRAHFSSAGNMSLGDFWNSHSFLCSLVEFSAEVTVSFSRKTHFI